MKNTNLTSRVLLGLLMLLSGLAKLFAFTPQGVANSMISKIFLFAWAPLFWAWVLIISEIVFGIAILSNWKLKYTTIPPMFILLVALLFAVIKWTVPTFSLAGIFGWQSWSGIIFHIIAIVGYGYLMKEAKN